ncbi:MAG: hypothetical protein J2P31_14180, partial [Blastocatellia bacterium]|nr:hypothetical protein [Blastocatellia bacterium]
GQRARVRHQRALDRRSRAGAPSLHRRDDCVAKLSQVLKVGSMETMLMGYAAWIKASAAT